MIGPQGQYHKSLSESNKIEQLCAIFKETVSEASSYRKGTILLVGRESAAEQPIRLEEQTVAAGLWSFVTEIEQTAEEEPSAQEHSTKG